MQVRNSRPLLYLSLSLYWSGAHESQAVAAACIIGYFRRGPRSTSFLLFERSSGTQRTALDRAARKAAARAQQLAQARTTDQAAARPSTSGSPFSSEFLAQHNKTPARPSLLGTRRSCPTEHPLPEKLMSNPEILTGPPFFFTLHKC